MKEEFYYSTNFQCFTKEQAEEHLKETVSVLNWDILLNHLTEPKFASKIEGFEEQNGVLFLKINGEMESVTHNLKNPIFSN